jgi:predicted nucleic acid-binding Zn ribbon protein
VTVAEGEAQRLGDFLEKAVIKPARKTRSIIQMARRKWIEVAGGETAAHSWPKRLRLGVLTVEVDSSALLAELAGYRQAELLRRLACGERPLSIRALRFVLSEEEK